MNDELYWENDDDAEPYFRYYRMRGTFKVDGIIYRTPYDNEAVYVRPMFSLEEHDGSCAYMYFSRPMTEAQLDAYVHGDQHPRRGRMVDLRAPSPTFQARPPVRRLPLIDEPAY